MGIFVTLALVVVGLTLVFSSMRAVMEIGGACADGGPYVPARPCPKGVGLAMSGGIWGGIIALAAYFYIAHKYSVPSLVGLAWSALFLSLGWNFFEFGFNSPSPDGGLEWGWLLCGVIFWLMGAAPLLIIGPYLYRSFWPSRPKRPVASERTTPAESGSTRSSHAAVRTRHQGAATPTRHDRERLEAMAHFSGLISAIGAGVTDDDESSPVDTSDLVSRLERLAALRLSGALSADEFDRAKRMLLGGRP